MTIHRVAKTTDFVDLKPIYLQVGGSTIAVYRYKDSYFAYLNKCPHQSGPVCEGALLPTVEGETTSGGEFRIFESRTKKDIVCPWHGIEFELESGVCRSDPKMRLRQYRVFARQGEVVLER